jgi:hypothetical protein
MWMKTALARRIEVSGGERRRNFQVQQQINEFIELEKLEYTFY